MTWENGFRAGRQLARTLVQLVRAKTLRSELSEPFVMFSKGNLQLLNNRGDIVVSSVDSLVAQFTDAVRQTPAHHLTIVQRYVGPSHGPEVQRYVTRNPGLSRRRNSRRKQRR